MSGINASPKYIKPITEVEYKQQSTDYTSNALKELKEQMKNQPIRKRVFNEQEPSSGSDDDTKLEDNLEGNPEDKLEDNPEIVIKHVINSGKSIPKSKSKLTTADNKHLDILESLQIKYDLIITKNNKLQDKIKTLSGELDDLGRRNHFLKLDLGNAKCEISEFKHQIAILESDNATYKIEIIKLQNNKIYLDRLNKVLLYCVVVIIIFVLVLV
jgi:hypothetical protein